MGTISPWRPNLRRWFTAETLVALASALTVVAISYREPLTSRTLDFGPEGANKSYYAYTYDDHSSGGASTVRQDPGRPLSWSCQLSPAYQWPYCGFGLNIAVEGHERGFDFSNYENVRINLNYSGDGKILRLILKDKDPRYQSLTNPTDKPVQVNVPVRAGEQSIDVSFDEFAVAEWWTHQTNASGELAKPSFRNIVTVEFITGTDLNAGGQKLRLERLRFERHLLTANQYYCAIAALWALFIGAILTLRRRQIAKVKRSARERERLHGSILEASSDCIVLFDPDGCIEFVNSAAVHALEFPPMDQTIGRHWSEFWTRDGMPEIANALERAAVGETIRLRGAGPTAKGTQRWWDAIFTPMSDDGGALKGILTVSRDVTSERERSEQLRWASEHDALTHLPNRRAFHARLQAATLRAMESGEEVGLLLIDLDHFKQVNDSFGHATGDDLLKCVATRLRGCVRERDFVARIGGDEFAVIVEQVRSPQVLISVGNDILSRIRIPVETNGRALSAGASIGGALFPANATSADDLFKNADTALYALKHSGRGGTRLFDTFMREETQRTASQLSLARDAINDQTLVPVYQPKVAIGTGETVGLEALLRWRHAKGGLQPPATLEVAFNDYELAARLGELMQRRVAEDICAWIASDVEFDRVSINAAPAEFLRDDYAERLLGILAACHVPADRIEIEVTEHALLGRGPEYVARALKVLKAAGATVSLDDFGTGCSSLSHLRDFPVDLVKIDMSFVQQMNSDPEMAAIVAAVVNLAHSLSIEAVAEGVETVEQLELLRAMGCHLAQGHLFGAAVEAADVPPLFVRSKAAAA